MEVQDPYRAPESRVAAELPEERLAIEAAGRWRRFFNWAIDYACFTLLSIALFIPYTVWLAMQGDEAGLAALEQPNFVRDYGIGVLGMLLYYVPMEGLFGFTIGKLVTGTRVVDEQGGRPTWRQVLIRTAMRFVPFEPLSAFGEKGSEPRPWHDTVAKTRVVRRRR